MKPRVLVTREVFDETIEYLRGHCDVEDNQPDIAFSPEELRRRAADKDGVVCSLTDRIDAQLIAGCAKLKVVANIAVGYNNIDVAACTAHGVMVTNTPGVLDDSTADLAWTLMLGTARRITEVERRVRNGEWTGWRLKQWLGTDVHHATLGIVGMGRIGQAIARRALGFDMRVLYHNRARVAEDIERRAPGHVDDPGRAAGAIRFRRAASALYARDAPPHRRGRAREDETRRDPDQLDARRRRG